MRRHLTQSEADTYLGGGFRARIIKYGIFSSFPVFASGTLFVHTLNPAPSVWRPLNKAVEDCPIALCDPRSVDPRDLLAADRVTPDFAVELYYLKHNPNQKWYWLANQAPDELTVFVNYDSKCTMNGLRWMSEWPHV